MARRNRVGAFTGRNKQRYNFLSSRPVLAAKYKESNHQVTVGKFKV